MQSIRFMNKGKVLISDLAHEYLAQALSRQGYMVINKPDIDDSGVEALLPELTGIIINSKTVMDRTRIKQAEKLNFIGRLGSGLEIIDLIAAQEFDVKVFNSPEGNRQAVAEHALGMLLALYNQIPKADREVRSFSWNREARRGNEISGKTIGIIGAGHTGSAFVKILSGFDADVLAFDKYKDVNFLKSVNSRVQIKTSMESVMAEADIISLHLPLTPETRNMANIKWLRACKPGSILINTSRGAIIDTQDLITSLQEDHIRGACLDVFENEKQSELTPKEKSMYLKLFEMENVILTPHVAGWTHESKYKLAKILADKINTL